MRSDTKIHFVIPYRDRAEHFAAFCDHIEHFAVGKFEPVIWLMEQAEGRPFNRGALLNLGVEQVLALTGDRYATIALHDVDMLPHGGVNYDLGGFDFLHIATAAGQFDHQQPYKDYFGGVVLTNPLAMLKAGGYPMDFWGWGGEDDALLLRVRASTTKWGHKMNQLFTSLRHDRVINRGEHAQNVAKLEAIRGGELLAGGSIHDTSAWVVEHRASLGCMHQFFCTPK